MMSVLVSNAGGGARGVAEVQGGKIHHREGEDAARGVMMMMMMMVMMELTFDSE